MWQFAEACRGLKDACLELGIPVTGGNVSLYNQTGETAILPTPGGRGARRDRRRHPAHAVGLRGRRRARSSCSARPARSSPARSGRTSSTGTSAALPPRVDLAAERALAELLRRRRSALLTSAHDLSDGGLAQALAESALRHGIGVTVARRRATRSSGCSPSRPPARSSPYHRDAAALTDLAARHAYPSPAGTSAARVGVEARAVPVEEIRTAWAATLPTALG